MLQRKRAYRPLGAGNAPRIRGCLSCWGKVTRERRRVVFLLFCLPSASGTMTRALLVGEGAPDRAADLFLAGCGLRAREALDALYFCRFLTFVLLSVLRGPLPWRVSRARRLDGREVSTSSGESVRGGRSWRISSAHSRLALQMCISQIRSWGGTDAAVGVWRWRGSGQDSNGEGIDGSLAGDVSCLGPGEKLGSASWPYSVQHSTSEQS